MHQRRAASANARTALRWQDRSLPPRQRRAVAPHLYHLESLSRGDRAPAPAAAGLPHLPAELIGFAVPCHWPGAGGAGRLARPRITIHPTANPMTIPANPPIVPTHIPTFRVTNCKIGLS